MGTDHVIRYQIKGYGLSLVLEEPVISKGKELYMLVNQIGPINT